MLEFGASYIRDFTVLACFHWFAPEQPAEQTIETPVIWDAIAPIMK